MKTFILTFLILMGLYIDPLLSQESPQNPSSHETPAKPSTDSEYAFPLEDILPPKPDHTDWFYKEFFNMMLMLGLLLTLVLGMAWLLKKVTNSRMEKINIASAIKILEVRNLSPKTGLYLLEIYGKTVAIAESHNGVTFLGDFPESSDQSSTFAKILEEKSKNR